MGVVIRSQGGQRSINLLSNHSKKESDPSVLRKEILEALRGLTFKIELKITDAIEASVSIHDNNSEQEGDTAGQPQVAGAAFNGTANSQVSFETPLGAVTDITKSLEEVLAVDDYRPPRSTTLDKLAKADKAPALKVSLEPAAVPSSTPDNVSAVPEPAQRPKPVSSLSFAPLQAIRRQTVAAATAVSSGDNEPAMTPTQQKQQPNVTTTTVRPPSPRSLRIEKIKDIKAKIDAEPAAPEKVTLPRGVLKIGKSVKTFLTSQTGDEIYVAHDMDKILWITEELNKISSDIDKQPQIFTLRRDDIVLAKSDIDQGWYRAIVTELKGSSVTVNFFDWGLSEVVGIADVRELTDPGLGVANVPACAVRINLINADKVPEDSDFSLYVESYDEFCEAYQARLMGA